jgi:hypothetical protein
MCHGFHVHSIDLEAHQIEQGITRHVLDMGLCRDGRALHRVGATIYSDDHPLTVAARLETLAGEIRSRMRGGG